MQCSGNLTRFEELAGFTQCPMLRKTLLLPFLASSTTVLALLTPSTEYEGLPCRSVDNAEPGRYISNTPSSNHNHSKRG
jgi:hypothetical protein